MAGNKELVKEDKKINASHLGLLAPQQAKTLQLN